MSHGRPAETPLKPSLALRVGVIGHRLNKLPESAHIDLVATLERILLEIDGSAQAAGQAVDPAVVQGPRVTMTCLSSLAEGSDRFGVHAALQAGYRLEGILPFPRDIFEADFSEAPSRQEFKELLSKADCVFEMDGDAGHRNRAYDAAARLLLNRSDILLAVWDGESAAGQGGTGNTVALAVAQGIPVIHLSPQSGGSADLLWTGGEELPAPDLAIDSCRRPLDAETLSAVMNVLLKPSSQSTEALKQYFADRRKAIPLALPYPLLLSVLTGKAFRRETLFPRPFVASAAAEWESYFADLRPGPLHDALRGVLLPAFAFADRLSLLNANLYRSAYVFNFIAAALAVTLALLGLVFPEGKFYLVGAEALIIASILFVTHLGQKRQWHRRWLERRELAETLRHLRILSLAGSAGSLPRPGGPHPTGQATSDWTIWYLRAVARMLPLPNVVVDSGYKSRLVTVLRDVEIASQKDYHRKTGRELHVAEHRLHLLGGILFYLTLGTCVAFSVLYLPVLHHLESYSTISKAVTIATALLPSFGAAFAGILAQADLGAVVRRSEETLRHLESLDRAIERDVPSLTNVTGRINTASEVMLSDLEAWRTIFVSRPLLLPS